MQKNFLLAVSKSASKGLKEKVKAMELHRRSGSTLNMLAEDINPIVRGWMNYFGRFSKPVMKSTLSVIQNRLIRWTMFEYKRSRGHWKRTESWLKEIKKREPHLFAHWALVG